MVYTYSHLYNTPASGLCFFAVYGSMGIPDMAYFNVTDKFFNNDPIHIFNNGDFDNGLYHDFTYDNDFIDGILKPIEANLFDNVKTISAEIFNIGNNISVKLTDFITCLEKALNNSLDKVVELKKIF